MRLGSPFHDLSEALAAAIYVDLPAIQYEDRDWDAWRSMSKEEQGEAMKNDTVPRVYKTRRPTVDDVEVVMFPQTWGSTALGYGGMGGAAMTPAYTVIVTCRNVSCVYFGGRRLAYSIDASKQSSAGKEEWRKDIAAHQLADCRGASQYL